MNQENQRGHLLAMSVLAVCLGYISSWVCLLGFFSNSVLTLVFSLCVEGGCLRYVKPFVQTGFAAASKKFEKQCQLLKEKMSKAIESKYAVPGFLGDN